MNMTTPTPHGATVQIIEPPDFDPRPGVTDGMSPDDLWQYACLVGYRYKLSEHDREQSARAAIQQAAGAVPKGWRLAPIEPTQAMKLAGCATTKESAVMCGNIYRAMLDASPAIEPPKQQPDSVHLAGGECGGVPQWLPIETAPKASKAILVHCADRKNTYTATWARDEEFPWSGKWKHFGGGFFDEVPTHWMPTPPAPAGQINPDSVAQGKEAGV